MNDALETHEKAATLRRRAFFWLLGLAALATIVLGVLGNHWDAVAGNAAPSRLEAWYVLDLLYRTMQLFLLEMSPHSYPIPRTLDAARWLGGLVAGVAIVKAAAEIFKRQIEDRRLRMLRGHVIVCGLGRKGLHLVKQLTERGDKVVVIEIDEGDDSLPECRELGATLIIGDARSEPLMRKARVDRAQRVIAVCKNDSDNIEIALQSRQLVLEARRDVRTPLICHVHIIDLKLAEMFRHHKIFACASDPFEARIFSFYENSARELLMRHPLDVAQPCHENDVPPGVHLLIVGCGQMGESVLLQAARIGHFASGRRLQISVLDPEADKRKLNLLSRYPSLEKVCDISFEQRSIEHPAVRQQLAEWSRGRDRRLIIALCIDDDPRALSIALNLPQAVREAAVPVFVRQSEQRGLSTLLDDRSASVAGVSNVASFGAPERAAGLGAVLQENLDILARSIHDWHRRMGPHGRPYCDAQWTEAARQDWAQLEAGLKASRRQQADHIDTKLRAIHCQRIRQGDKLPPGTQPLEQFAPEELELLARMEHARWCADRYLAGWQLGDSDDPVRFTSPNLVPFDQLADPIKEYDRQAVLQLPELIALAGERIVRVC